MQHYFPFCLRLVLAVGLLAAGGTQAAGLSDSDDFTVQVWDTDSGLPQSSVTSLAQTPDGYGWTAQTPGLPQHPYSHAKESGVAQPSDSVVFADAALVSNPSDPNADGWVKKPATASIYFRVPSDVQNVNEYINEPTRSVGRHNGRLNASFFDGHVASVKNSSFGYQLTRTDDGALWARNHNGLVP